MPSPRSFLPAFTLRSALASAFAMLATAGLIHHVHVVLAASSPGEHALVLPGLWVFLGILGLVGLFAALLKVRLLTRPELLCVIYSILIAGPMMSQGFWHRVLAIASTIPRTEDFAKIDAYSEKFWPGGANLLEAVELRPGAGVSTDGEAKFGISDAGESSDDSIVEIRQTDADAVSAVIFEIPVAGGGEPPNADEVALPGQPYLITALIQPVDLGNNGRYFIQLQESAEAVPREIVRSRSIRGPTAIHPDGFQREGAYGVLIPKDATGSIQLRVGLEGTGHLRVRDPQVINVAALTDLFQGRKAVSESEYEALDPGERHGLVVRPDSMWSPAGLAHLIRGYVPWGAWVAPLIAWGGLLLLVLGGTFAIAVLMRRKWIETERLPLPLAQIPRFLIGAEPGTDGTAGQAPIWKNGMVWLGFGLGFLWCFMKVWSFYNTNVPDPSLSVPLGPYFGPAWGDTFNITFSVMAVFLSVAIFVELNVLLSFVVGFFMFRLLFWYGHVSGLDANPGFPYAQEQQLGAYLVYASLLVWFSRAYFKEIFGKALKPDPAQSGEALSYRGAFLLLAAVFMGAAAWARWTELSVFGVLFFLAFLLTIGFVAMRIRTECGVPYGYFTPNNAALIIMLAGGIEAFGPNMVVFAFTASFFITVAGFFLIPGAQLELLELGRRYGVQPRHLVFTALFAVVGGLMLGGWSFLSSSYASGGDTMRYAWAYQEKPWYYTDLNQALAQADLAAAGEATEESEGLRPATVGYVYGGGITAVLAILRQFFAGFWLHPIGFMLGSTAVMGAGAGALWGSLLMAWFIRSIVARLGGAQTVREKLLPFFFGVFLSALLVLLLNALYASLLRARGVENIFSNLV